MNSCGFKVTDGEGCVTAWNWFYPGFLTLIKILPRRQNFSALPHNKTMVVVKNFNI